MDTTTRKEDYMNNKSNEPIKLLYYQDVLGRLGYEQDEWWCYMGKCPTCGEQMPIEFKFCGNCGQPLKEIDLDNEPVLRY